MLEPNTILQERYQVAHLIGQGGMGAVYEAVDLRLGNTVALKQTLVPGGQVGKAFEREARLLAGLRHPSLPKVIDHFAEANGQYLVMEFIPGEDLAALLQRRDAPFGVREVLEWAAQLLRVLEYLHTREPPILHRDIKPQNLKLTAEGALVLLDFGLAKGDPSLQTHVSDTGSVFGYTPHYAPLEQVHNSGTDARSDLYALAATMHHLLTGARPIDALTRATTVLRRQPDPLRSPTDLNPRVPPEVSRVLMQALSLNQDDRPADAAAMGEALARATEEVGLAPDVPGESLYPSVSRGAAPPPADDAPTPVRPGRHLPRVRERLDLARLPETLAAGPLRRWAALVAGAAVLLALLLAVNLGREPQRAAESPAVTQVRAPTQEARPTPEPATTVAGATVVAGGATVLPSAAGTSAPARAASLAPADADARSLPITVTVQGELLDTVREFRFSAPGGATILPEVRRSRPDETQLVIAEVPPMQGGEQAFTLFLDGEPQPLAVVLRDYREIKEMRGVRADYAYTGRVQSDETGAFTQMLSEPSAESQPAAVLRAGDQVDLLRDDVPGWYQVRLWIEGQATRASVVGWVERWLVDGEGVPQPVPLAFAGRLVQTPTDAAVQCGSQFRSSVWGSVNRPNEAGVAGALVRVTSADGRNRFTQRTDSGGSFEIGGLGCTVWIVELVEVPGATSFTANAVRANLNGGRYTSAEVRFRQQP